MRYVDDASKHTLDVGAVVIMGASFAEWLPPIAAGLSIMWLSTRLFEYARWLYQGRKKEDKP